MDAKLLDRAVKEDLTGILHPVLEASYSLEPLSNVDIIVIATNVNKQLGYDLFKDLYYPRLILDFSRVSRAVQINALRST